jgi:hypothetical protein
MLICWARLRVSARYLLLHSTDLGSGLQFYVESDVYYYPKCLAAAH